MISPISTVGVYSIPLLVNNQQDQVGNRSVSENIVVEKAEEIKKAPQVSWEQFRQKVLLGGRVYLSEEEEEALCRECNEFLFKHPCICQEDYQLRIAELRCIQRAVCRHGRLCEMLQQHLLHAEQAIQILIHHSKNPVQESFWPLYQRILQLPTLQPDFFGAALAVLHEKLPQATKGEWKEQLHTLLPRLLPPAHFFYGMNATELQEVQQACRLLLHRMGEEHTATFAVPLQTIYGTYSAFSEAWEHASAQKRREMILPKAQLKGIGLGHFSLDREAACRLLSRDIAGRDCHTNQQGTHAVHREEGVFYKPNPEGRFSIGPEVEFAIYALYHLLGNQGTAPVSLVKLSHVFFEGKTLAYERVAQAGYGVDGVLLQEMLGMAEATSLLERCFGLARAKEVLAELLHLKNNGPAGIEGTVEERAIPFINRFTALFSPLPSHKRCLEFVELPVTERSKRDLYAHIARYSTERLEGALALLERFPELAVISGKAGLRNSSLVELTDLWLFLQRIRHHFPSLSPEEIWEELATWQERWDPVNFSLHFVATLLSRPFDHKTDNLMVTWERTEKGNIRTIQLIGIDNDLAFAANPEGVRTALYLLKPMERLIDPAIMQKIQEPAQLVLDWLVALETQNQQYELWRKQGTLRENDLWEEGINFGEREPALRIPLEIPEDLIPRLYAQLQALKHQEGKTHRELLQALEPSIAQAYHQAQEQEEAFDQAYAAVKNGFFEGKREAEAPKQKVTQAALEFVKGLSIESFPLKQQVSLLGQALDTFPDVSQHISLTGKATDPASRQEFFFLAVKQKHYALVARCLEEERKERLQLPEEFVSLLERRTPEEQTPFLLAVQNGDLAMCQLLLSYGADPQATDVEGRGALSLCLQRFANAPTEACRLASFLVERDLLLNSASGHRRWTPLHYLVRAATQNPEEAEPLLAYLIPKGACPDLVDCHGQSPLDLAIEQGNERLVTQLISLGAGRTLQVTAAQAFFAQRPHLNAIYDTLKQQSPLLRWHILLQELRTQNSPSRCTLEGVELGKISLSSSLQEVLLDEAGEVQNQIPYGRRRIARLTLASGETLFCKQYPEMPGVEYAINTLFTLLIGHGTSTTDLARLTTSRGKSYPVLLSRGIQGENLHDVLCSPEKAHLLDQLDPLSFSELFLASLLVNFEDAKPDNFILEPQPDGTYRLVSIDNDHAFVPPLGKKQQRTVPLVKCILYCLEIMQRPIHPAARERFLSFTPEHWMKLWLQQLHEKNEQYCALFPNGKKKLFKDHGVVIPIPFRPKSMIDLYQKFHRLQWALKESPKLTGMELLRLVIPELGIRYEEAFHQHNRPLDRFFSLTSTQYSTAIAGRYETLINSRKMLKSMQITEQVAYDPLSEQGPASALHELDSIEQERRWEGARLKQVRDALQAGETAPFLKLDLDLSKEKVINGLPGLFDGIDFQAMKKRGNPDLEKQKKVFSALLTGSYRTLCLKGCAVLNSTTWERLIKASPQLLTLDLRACPNIDDIFLLNLEQAPFLNRLRLVDLPKLSRTRIPHPTLRRLELQHCQGMRQLTVSHTLQHLSIKACWEVESIQAQLYEPPKRLRSSRMKKEATDFRFASLSIHACPNLWPWRNRFASYLQASTEHTLYLEKVSYTVSNEQQEWDLLLAALASPSAKELLFALVDFYRGREGKFAKLAQALSDFLENPSFGFLSLSYTDATDTDLTALASLPNLQKLNLTWCDKITDKGLEKLAKLCPGLKELWLCGCEKITDGGLGELAKGCNGLQELNLTNCGNITDRGLEDLAKGCIFLQRLDLNGCRITDRGLKELIWGCVWLKRLSLKNCNQITDKGLEELAKGRSLQEIDLSGCGQITDVGLDTLHYSVVQMYVTYVPGVAL